MIPEYFAARYVLMFLAVMALAGCKDEMPQPPAQEFANSAEADFNWAMERLRHAIDLLRAPSSLGIRVKRDMDYELFPPDKENANYTARVTITSKTTFIHDKPTSPSEKLKKQKELAKKQAAEQKAKRDPFARQGEEPITGSTTIDEELVQVGQRPSEIVETTIPPQELEIKEDFKLEYVDGAWKQLNPAEEEHIQLWFDYALQQGEYDLREQE